jgi:potassium/chloride transporter 4/5/6
MNGKKNSGSIRLPLSPFFKRGPSGPVDGKLGTFIGVFTPTLLTILGVIMYLRVGWLVGNMGLVATLSIVVLANLVTLTTTLSFSSIATNKRIGIGGAYNIISRNLGLEIGGAIGLPLFLSQAFSVTLYAFGLAESLRFIWPSVPVAPAAFVIVLGIGALASKGSAIALKVQLPLLVLVALSLAVLITGAIANPLPDLPPVALSSGEVDYWVAFAVFFPAVTGVMAGLGLSGDLRDSRASIPRGSISAVLLGFVVYLTIPIMLYLGADTQALRDDPMVWTRIAPLGALLILPGLWGAIFSSAVGSVLGAPRTLQALALDHLAPKQLARTMGPREEPMLGLLVTLVIALGACLLGDLNAVAPIVTMFFLTVYGTVNLVAAFAYLSGEISWRPTLRIPWIASLTAGVACIVVMFLISPVAAVAALGAEVIVWLILARKERTTAWGDARRGLYEALMRWALVKISAHPMTARSWRPHVMIFVKKIERNLELIHFGRWFAQGRGVVTVCELVEADLAPEVLHTQARRREMEGFLAEQGITAFAEADVVRNVEDGLISIAQANGMGGLNSNTLLMGWPGDQVGLERALRSLRAFSRLGKSLIIGRIVADSPVVERDGREIHIWWGGLQRNGDLMLLLAYLLSRNAEWRGARLVVSSLASSELMRVKTRNHLNKLLPELRIDATSEVIMKPPGMTVREVIFRHSESADVVFLGLSVPEPGKEAEAARRMAEMAEGLPTVFFVNNSSPFGGELVET